MANNNLVVLSKTKELLSTQLSEKLEGLPKGFQKERFVQNCMTVLQDEKKMSDFAQCSPQSLVMTLMKGATLGLDFFNNECYAIPYKGNVTFQTDYKGETKLVKKYSLRRVRNIYAKVVRKGDFFEESIERGEQSISFKPLMFSNEDIIGAFAVVQYEDGGMDYETMSKEDIDGVRKNFSKVTRPDSAWNTSYGEMCKKTVLRRLCKHIDIEFESVEMAKAFDLASDMEFDKSEKKQVVPDVLKENHVKAVEEIKEAEFIQLSDEEVTICGEEISSEEIDEMTEGKFA